MILLDTHVLLWMDTDDAALGKSSRRLLREAWADGHVAVSAISFWECAMLNAAGRIVLPVPPETWRAELIGAGLHEIPLTGDAALLAVALRLPHKDPADRFIAATAWLHDAALMTADKGLLRWRHELKRHDAAR